MPGLLLLVVSPEVLLLSIPAAFVVG